MNQLDINYTKLRLSYLPRISVEINLGAGKLDFRGDQLESGSRRLLLTAASWLTSVHEQIIEASRAQQNTPHLHGRN
jgi:hypothetical protein